MGALTSALSAQMIQAIAAGDTQTLAQVLNQLMRAPQTGPTVATTYPGNGIPYTNPGPYLQTVTIDGGTITVITLSQGGITGLTSGQFLLRPGDAVTCTSSVNPTVFNVTNIL
jgi:hypothetical protein